MKIYFHQPPTNFVYFCFFSCRNVFFFSALSKADNIKEITFFLSLLNGKVLDRFLKMFYQGHSSNFLSFLTVSQINHSFLSLPDTCPSSFEKKKKEQQSYFTCMSQLADIITVSK